MGNVEEAYKGKRQSARGMIGRGKRQKKASPPFPPSHRAPRTFLSFFPVSLRHKEALAQERGVSSRPSGSSGPRVMADGQSSNYGLVDRAENAWWLGWDNVFIKSGNQPRFQRSLLQSLRSERERETGGFATSKAMRTNGRNIRYNIFKSLYH